MFSPGLYCVNRALAGEGDSSPMNSKTGTEVPGWGQSQWEMSIHSPTPGNYQTRQHESPGGQVQIVH